MRSRRHFENTSRVFAPIWNENTPRRSEYTLPAASSETYSSYCFRSPVGRRVEFTCSPVCVAFFPKGRLPASLVTLAACFLKDIFQVSCQFVTAMLQAIPHKARNKQFPSASPGPHSIVSALLYPAKAQQSVTFHETVLAEGETRCVPTVPFSLSLKARSPEGK